MRAQDEAAATQAEHDASLRASGKQVHGFRRKTPSASREGSFAAKTMQNTGVGERIAAPDCQRWPWCWTEQPQTARTTETSSEIGVFFPV